MFLLDKELLWWLHFQRVKFKGRLHLKNAFLTSIEGNNGTALHIGAE